MQQTLQQNTHAQCLANTQQLSVHPQPFPQTQTSLLLQPLPLHCSLLFPQGPRRRPSVPPTQPAFYDPYYPSMQQLSLTHVPYRFSQAGVLGLLARSFTVAFSLAQVIFFYIGAWHFSCRLDVIVVKSSKGFSALESAMLTAIYNQATLGFYIVEQKYLFDDHVNTTMCNRVQQCLPAFSPALVPQVISLSFFPIGI